MIQLTRLNGKSLAVNSDLIKFIEQSPDTLVTLITGEKIVVRESADEVRVRIIEFRRAVLQQLANVWEVPSPQAFLIDPPSDDGPEPEGK
jgi:flagellar protein FlbD